MLVRLLLHLIRHTERQKLEVIENRRFCSARRAADLCTSNYDFCSCCNIVTAEQCILALADCWWRRDAKNNKNIINFTYHHQRNTNARTPLNIIKGSRFL